MNDKEVNHFLKSPPISGKTDHWYPIDSIDGLYIRQYPSGICSYYIRIVDIHKKQVQMKIGKCSQISLAKAKAFVKDNLPHILTEGVQFVKPPQQKKTPSGQELFEAWKEWAENHPGLPEAVRPRLLELWSAMTQFHKLKIGEISLKEIENNLQIFFSKDTKQRANPLKAATVNRYVTEIKFLIKWAIAQGLIEKENCHWFEVKKIPETDSTPKTDHFTDEEREAIREAAKQKAKEIYFGRRVKYISYFIETLLGTGQRPGTVLGLLWSDFDAAKKTLVIRANNIKTRNYTVLPISDYLSALLQQWRQETAYAAETDFIFSSEGCRIKSVKRQMKSIYARAEKIMGKSFHFHPTAYSMRHDHASEILVNGGNITDVQHALIHSTPKMSSKYAHASEDRMRDIANRLAPTKK